MMAESADRVCPRCGHAADEHPFCPECGLDLKSQGQLPTRAEWIQSRQQPAAAAPAPAPAPAAERAEPGPPSRGGEPFSQSRLLPALVIVVGVALAIFGIVRIVGGDSEVGRLEDERDSLQEQQQALVADRAPIEKAGQETDAALADFIEGAETVGEQWEAAVAANNRIVSALNAGAEASGGALEEGRAANDALRKSVNQAERLLEDARQKLSGLDESISEAEG